jgi:hypothetical protein
VPSAYDPAMEALWAVGALAAYFVLMRWVLPWFGVQT